MIPKFPDDCIQSIAGSWWTEDPAKTYCRGRLVRAFLPHVDQIPNTITAVGRGNPTDHKSAEVIIEPLRVKQRRRPSSLPVAALPDYPGEVRTVYRAKRRPAVILSEGGDVVPRKLIIGKPAWQTAPTILVAPYYGADEDGTSSGFNLDFVERIKSGEYPQFMWDMLPLTGKDESILRMDHIQPIGQHHDSIEVTDYRLSDDAMVIIDEWLTWIFTGKLFADGLLSEIRIGLSELST